MNIKHLLFYSMTLMYCTQTYSMKEHVITHDNHKTNFLSIPEDMRLYIIAHYQIKDALRETCRYFRDLASSTNEKILTHPSLVLSEKALERFVLYRGFLGDSAIVRNLLAIGADPNACDDNKMTIMHYTAQYGYVDIVDMLLKHPALITSDITNGKKSPWMLAIQYDQNAIVKHIFLTCKLHGGNALMNAAVYGAIKSLHTLLACDIDPNSPSSSGEYPLICAANKGHIHIIRLLIANGATVNCRCKNKNNTNAAPLHFAAFNSHVLTVQLLIEYGADVNIKGPSNVTPLHNASDKSNTQIIKILLDNGAHVNARLDNGNTPLDVAKNDDVKQLLIAHGGKTGSELKQAALKQNNPEKDNCVMQ